MTREDKHKKRIQRSVNRRSLRMEKYISKIRTANTLGVWIPLHAVDKNGYVTGSWADPNSPTGYSQKCSYDAWGTCQSPCNGDC
jgi:hypothetical protein